MRIGILGTGMVGQGLGSKLVAEGHSVMLGSRTPDNEKATAWADEGGDRAHHGTFSDAAAFGEVVLLCASGQHALAVVAQAGQDNLRGKVLVDVSNPLAFAGGIHLTVANTDSLGEQIQAAVPGTKVVKALNMVSTPVMVDPQQLGEPTDIMICGNDPEAKAQVAGWLTAWFGWGEAIDLGDITAARGQEAWLLLWARLWGALGTTQFNIRVVRAPSSDG